MCHQKSHWAAPTLTSPRLPERLGFDTSVVLDDGRMMIMMIFDADRMSLKTYQKFYIFIYLHALEKKAHSKSS